MSTNNINQTFAQSIDGIPDDNDEPRLVVQFADESIDINTDDMEDTEIVGWLLTEIFVSPAPVLFTTVNLSSWSLAARFGLARLLHETHDKPAFRSMTILSCTAS